VLKILSDIFKVIYAGNLALLALLIFRRHSIPLTMRQLAIGTRAFPVAGPRVWNSLPADITSWHRRCRPFPPTTHLFRQLFTHLTVQSLGGPCCDIHLGHFKKTLIKLIELKCYAAAKSEDDIWSRWNRFITDIIVRQRSHTVRLMRCVTYTEAQHVRGPAGICAWTNPVSSLYSGSAKSRRTTSAPTSRIRR